MWVYFWSLHSVASIYVYLYALIPHRIDYCSFTVSLEIRESVNQDLFNHESLLILLGMWKPYGFLDLVEYFFF